MQILVVDDHALFRECLCHVLNQIEGEITTVEASSCDEAIQYASEYHRLDLVLLDLNMPGMDSFESLDLFSTRFPALPVVILSASILRTDVQRALDKGAVGFIHKDTTTAVLLNALRMILSGGIYVPPNLAQSSQDSQSGQVMSGLTPRQRQVLALMSEGHSNKVIASDMELSVATVKMHITAIFRQLGVSNRTQAALEYEKLTLNFG